MPKIIKKLTYREIEEAPIANRPYKLCDEGGLRLLIRPSGTKVWQVPYILHGKPNTYTIGRYSNNGRAGMFKLSEARKARDEVKALITQGIDPNKRVFDSNKIQHFQPNGPQQDYDTSFEFMAREWHTKGIWVQKHAKNILSSLENDVFPHIGHKRIDQIKAQDIVQLLEKIERRGALDVAHRVCQRCCAVFDYAIYKGLCEHNPAQGRSKFISKNETKHRPHLQEHQLPAFIEALNHYHGRKYIKIAMQILMRTFVRPGELRRAQWQEIDFDKALWFVPSEHMKMRKPHVVPLSKQVLILLTDLHKITGHNDNLYPSVKSAHTTVSDVTFNKVLQILDFKDQDGDVIVPHGFRHTASTILNENRFNGDVIERQLAHKDKDKIRGVYNHAEYMKERVNMMQWYSDHLDKLAHQA